MSTMDRHTAAADGRTPLVAHDATALRARLRHLRQRREAVLRSRGSRDVTAELEQLDRAWAGTNRALDAALGRRRR